MRATRDQTRDTFTVGDVPPMRDGHQREFIPQEVTVVHTNLEPTLAVVKGVRADNPRVRVETTFTFSRRGIGRPIGDAPAWVMDLVRIAKPI